VLLCTCGLLTWEGCLRRRPAVTGKWGDTRRLRELAAEAPVEVMASSSAHFHGASLPEHHLTTCVQHVFPTESRRWLVLTKGAGLWASCSGALGSHARHRMPFGDFLDVVDAGEPPSPRGVQAPAPAAASSRREGPDGQRLPSGQKLYLAQVRAHLVWSYGRQRLRVFTAELVDNKTVRIRELDWFTCRGKLYASSGNRSGHWTRTRPAGVPRSAWHFTGHCRFLTTGACVLCLGDHVAIRGPAAGARGSLTGHRMGHAAVPEGGSAGHEPVDERGGRRLLNPLRPVPQPLVRRDGLQARTPVVPCDICMSVPKGECHDREAAVGSHVSVCRMSSRKYASSERRLAHGRRFEDRNQHACDCIEFDSRARCRRFAFHTMCVDRQHRARPAAQALHGEASNHSAVDLTAIDRRRHPRFEEAERETLHAELLPGDTLFIPEGWWHQVESDDRTTAINLWWDSQFTKKCMSSHMDTYYARRLLGSLLDTEKRRCVSSP
jgi:hypothetical protein